MTLTVRTFELGRLRALLLWVLFEVNVRRYLHVVLDTASLAPKLP